MLVMRQIGVRTVCALALVTVAEMAFAAAVDGTFIQPVDATRSYSTKQYWLHTTPASGGGRLTFANQTGCTSVFNVNTANLVWGGIDFADARLSMDGEPFTLSGDGELRTVNADGPFIRNTVTIPAGSTMTKRGIGKLSLVKAFEGAGKLVVAEGCVISQSTGAFVSKGDIDVRTGHLSWYRPVSTEPLAVSCGTLTYGPDQARLIVTRGDMPSYTVTFGALAQSAQGGFLNLQTTGTIDALGDTEKFLVAGRASDDGFIDASVVSRGNASVGSALHFLTYDAEKGFIPAEEAAFVEGQAADGKVAVISESLTIAKDTAVSALLVKNGAVITVASGVTLTVGDGVHPAGIIWQGTGLPAGTSQHVWNGPGSIQFKSGSEGFLYFNANCAANSSSWTLSTCLRLNGLVLKGDRGVTFAGTARDHSDYGTVILNGGSEIGWTGGTHVLGTRLQLNTSTLAQNLPGPVYVLGDYTDGYGGQIRQNNAGPFAQDFYLGGCGIRKDIQSHGGVFNWGGNPSAVFTGKVTLLNDAQFTHDNQGGNADGNGNLVFKGGLTGPGALRVLPGDHHSRFDIAGPADFKGGLTAGAQTQGLYISGPAGEPGAGPMVMTHAKMPVEFRKLMTMVSSNDFDVAGTMTFTQCTNLTFLGHVQSGAATLNDGLVLACGTNGVNLGTCVSSAGATFTAAVPGGTLQVGTDGADFAFGAMTQDGADGQAFTLEKVGANTVTMFPLARTQTGPTRVLEGTLKLDDDIFASPDIAYWLDASDASTLTVEDGRVVAWRSKKGVDGIAFVPAKLGANASYGPTQTTMNGKTALEFAHDDLTRLAATNTVTGGALPQLTQRTVFIVTAPRKNGLADGMANAGIFGQWSSDHGQRWGSKGWDVRGEGDGTGAIFDTVHGLRLDGLVRPTSEETWGGYYQYHDGQAQIVTMRHEKDFDIYIESLKCTYRPRAVFTPGLGDYCGAEPHRTYNGDIAEVIAFTRLLTEGEMRQVERYLGEKWGIALSHAGTVDETFSTYSPTSPVEVAKGAVLDLNGASATVAALAGAGTITNSSETLAILAVTGANAFRGIVSGNIRLVLAGGGTSEMALRNGASLALAGGTATLDAHRHGVVTEGLSYWLDAMKPETVLRDGAGLVTNWLTRAGTVPGFHNPGTVKSPKGFYYAPPAYEATAYNGKPGIRFRAGIPANEGTNALVSTAKSTVRTVILVGKIDGNGIGQMGMWNVTDDEKGIFPQTARTGGFALRSYTGTTFHRYGGLQRVQGINTSTGAWEFFDHTFMTNADGDFPAPGEFILVSEVEEGMDSASSFKNVNYLLGCGYHRAWKGWLFEVIAYDRCLSLDEVKVMEKYLVEKWFNAEPFADTLSALDANGTDLSLAGGASLDLAGQPLAVNGEVAFDLGTGTAVAPFTVTGDLTLGALARLVYSNGQNLDSSRKWPTLQVTGTVEGNFAAVTGVPGRFASSRDATGWSLAPSGMLLIFR